MQEVYSFNRWSGKVLARHLEKEFGVTLTPTHINRLRKQLQPIRIIDLSVFRAKKALDRAEEASKDSLMLESE